MSYFFTSESVSAGHPDKVADQISDAILDAYLAQDPAAKVACESLCTTDLVVVAGEVKSTATVEVCDIVRQTIAKIGYNDHTTGFDATTCHVANLMHEQSADIRQGVEQEEQGAGDQGIMFGYAVRETKELMPATLALSHLLLQELDAIRNEGEVMLYLRPDAKSQVTIEYNDYGVAERIDTIVISTQHAEGGSSYDILQDVTEHLIPRVIAKDEQLAELFKDDYRLLVNPTGRFVVGGPDGDTGLTGRKIIVDTYGGHAAHGGGAFSGKDSSKVDRSAAYMARYIAKNIVASGLADKAQVQIAYAIGVAEPVSLCISTALFGGELEVCGDDVTEMISSLFDMTPAGIVKKFGLCNPIYEATATYGHFGKEPYTKDGIEYFAWEKVDMAEAIFAYCNDRCQS
ncbi:MAG: methionine adenosyltransferase [Rikenellaceae bacterium]